MPVKQQKPSWEDRLRRERPLDVLRAIQTAEVQRSASGLPPDPDLLIWRGSAYNLLARFEEALNCFAKAEYLFERIGLDPDPVLFRKRGLVYYNLVQYEKAMVEYAEAEKLRKKQALLPDPKLAMDRGLIYTALGRYVDALAAYSLSEQLHEQQSLPPEPYLMLNCGLVYFKLGRYNEALEAFAKAEKQNKAQNLLPIPMLDINRGVLYSITRRYEQAMECYAKAEKLSEANYLPSWPEISVGRALLYKIMGDLKKSALQACEAMRRYSEQGRPVPRFIAELAQAKTMALLEPDKPIDKPGPPPQPLESAPLATETQYDAFISHRHSSAADKAYLLKVKLDSMGFKIYLDVTKQRKGNWRSRLLNAVRESSNLLVILDDGALDKCCDESDMLRQELEEAQKYQRNVIPIKCDDFHWHTAPKLPESIVWLPEQQDISFSREYFDAFADLLADWLSM